MSAKLSEEQIADLRESFNLFDKDGNGTIETSELKQVMISLGQTPTDSQVREMIRKVDADSNGTIEFEEFLTLMSEMGADPETELRETFNVFDKNGDGYINLSELQQVMANFGEKISEAEAQLMIQEADINGDGRINYEEFVKMMGKK